MAGTSTSAVRALVVGANHRSSSLALRDSLFVEDADVAAFLRRLRDRGVGEAIILSTCDRVEIQAAHGDCDEATRAITETLAGHAGLAPSDLEPQLYVLQGEEAVRHIFAVAASLDSLMVGEPQVMGQIKASHRMARDAGLGGGILEAVLQASYGAAKRVRNETAIAERPVSIAAAAVQLARDVHGDLARCTGIMLGVGEMGEMVARSLMAAGLGSLSVLHANDTRAETMARGLGCHVVPIDGLARILPDADIVLTCLGSRRHTLSADMVRAALAKRRLRPVFLADAAIPGDIEPAVNRIDEVFLYDLGDLERVAMEGRVTREGEVEGAMAIIDAEVRAFLRGQAGRSAVPALTRLRGHFEAVRRDALAAAGGDAEKATRLLVSRLLHGPSEAMRRLAGREGAHGGPDWAASERTIETLFGLGDSGADDGATEEEE